MFYSTTAFPLSHLYTRRVSVNVFFPKQTEKRVWVWVQWSEKNLKSSSARVPPGRKEQRSASTISTMTDKAELLNSTGIRAVYEPVQK